MTLKQYEGVIKFIQCVTMRELLQKPQGMGPDPFIFLCHRHDNVE